MADSIPLLNQAFIERLRRLIWSLARLRSGAGDRGAATRRTGGTHAFLGHRPYSPGDEPRHVDWNAYGRTDQVVVKVFGREEDHTVDILLDATASMGCGDPLKAMTARDLAAALGYLALQSGHRLRLGILSGGRLSLRGPLVGLESVAGYFQDLEGLGAAVGTDSAGGLRAYLGRVRRPGAVVLLSDGLEGGAWTEGVAHLGDAAGEASLFHVLSPQDLRPDFTGRVFLKDVEASRTLEARVNASVLGKYADRVAAFRRELLGLCQNHGIGYQFVSSRDSLEATILAWYRARKAG